MTNHLFDTLFANHGQSERVFIDAPGRPSISFTQFNRQTGLFAQTLVTLGVAPGDRVAVQVDKSPEVMALYLGAVRAGAVFLPLNTAYTANEVAYFLEDAQPVLFICTPSREATLAPVAEKAGARLMTMDAQGGGSLNQAVAEQDVALPAVPRIADDLAAILYTSGTTGRSKGAMLSHDNLASNARVLADYWHFTADDVLLHALPVYHTHGLFVGPNVALMAGASMIFHPRFDADQVIADLPRANTMMGVPTFYTRLLAHPDFTAELTRHMRLFISGSAPLLAETHRQFQQRTGHMILERYGMTETSMSTSNPYDGDRRAGTVGFPLPGLEARIADPETGTLLANGEVGVLEVRGANVFKGYWNMPEKTAEEFRDDGFFITGDLATIDDDGYVTIVGRGKDLIISGGFNVYPKEVEQAVDDIDGVVESAVIGVSHPDFGEAVVAVVVADSDTRLNEADIVTALGDRLAKFKQPKRVFFVESLPRNTMGKVQKNLLRERYGDLFASA